MRFVKYHPANHFASIIDELANKSFSDWFNHDFSTSMHPSVNIKETESGYSLELAAPGLNKEDFNIEIKEDQLIIKVEAKSDSEQENGAEYKRREFKYNAFTRSFHLSKKVNREAIKATYENGILLLDIPKLEQESLVKKIEIG